MVTNVFGAKEVRNAGSYYHSLLHKIQEEITPLFKGSRAASLLGSWVRIPPGAWIFVCCECRVLSGRGLCDELITRPEQSYRLCCVVVCDLETSSIGAPYIYIYIYICVCDISRLRVNTEKYPFRDKIHKTKATKLLRCD